LGIFGGSTYLIYTW